VPLHVKICEYCTLSPCRNCGDVNGDNKVVQVFAGTGESSVGPYCKRCWNEHGTTDGDIVLSVPQAELAKGGPPGRKEKKRSQRQELRIAQDLAGKMQSGSGNQDHSKGDVRVKGKFRVEAKFTRNKSYSLTREVLEKINGECHGMEKPVLQLDFLNPRTLREEGSYVVIPYEDWKELIGASD
jgi:hypothetical protein